MPRSNSRLDGASYLPADMDNIEDDHKEALIEFRESLIKNRYVTLDYHKDNLLEFKNQIINEAQQYSNQIREIFSLLNYDLN